MEPLKTLGDAYRRFSRDSSFKKELANWLEHYAGRPTPLYFASRLTDDARGAKLYLKREDLLHGGAHKINNTLGQALLAKKMGKRRIIAETGARRQAAQECDCLRWRRKQLNRHIPCIPQ